MSSADQDASMRVWEHALHEESTYNDRLNFFLVAEAMLLVFHATLIDLTADWTLVAIALLGLLLTFFWMIVNRRQEADLETAVERLETYCPEFRQYKEAREQKQTFRFADKLILGTFVPILIAAIWIALLIEAATRA